MKSLPPLLFLLVLSSSVGASTSVRWKGVASATTDAHPARVVFHVDLSQVDYTHGGIAFDIYGTYRCHHRCRGLGRRGKVTGYAQQKPNVFPNVYEVTLEVAIQHGAAYCTFLGLKASSEINGNFICPTRFGEFTFTEEVLP
jgi:hypothetical protein